MGLSQKDQTKHNTLLCLGMQAVKRNLNERYGAMGQRAWVLGSQSGSTSQKKSVNKLCLICVEMCLQFYMLCFTSSRQKNRNLWRRQWNDAPPYSKFFSENGVDELCLICVSNFMFCASPLPKVGALKFSKHPYLSNFPPKMVSVNCALFVLNCVSNFTCCASPFPKIEALKFWY